MNRPVPGTPIPGAPPGPTCVSRTARPAGLRGNRARSGRLAPRDPAARLPRPEPRSLLSKGTSALWPTRSAPARRVLQVGRPLHKVKGTRNRAGRGVMEHQGRPGFSAEGLWEGTPREDRVTARARARGGPPRTLGKGWSPGAVAGNAPAQWILVPRATGDHRRQPLYPAFSAPTGHPPLQERPMRAAPRSLPPTGAGTLLHLGVFQGPERHPHAPGGAITPGKRGRAGRPPRPRPCPREGRCLLPERAKQGGSAEASRGPRHPPIGGATE